MVVTVIVMNCHNYKVVCTHHAMITINIRPDKVNSLFIVTAHMVL